MVYVTVDIFNRTEHVSSIMFPITKSGNTPALHEIRRNTRREIMDNPDTYLFPFLQLRTFYSFQNVEHAPVQFDV